MGAISLTVENPSGGLYSNLVVEDQAFYTNALLPAYVANPLAGVYTSPAIALKGRRIVGSVWATQDGATGASLIAQGSDDGINWKTIPTVAWTATSGYLLPTATVSASTQYIFEFLLYNALTRVVYTNGAAAMVAGTDTFRLAGYLSPV